jgi:hypothetical protein
MRRRRDTSRPAAASRAGPYGFDAPSRDKAPVPPHAAPAQAPARPPAGMPGDRVAARPAPPSARPGRPRRAGSVAALAAHREHVPRKEPQP